MKFRVHHIMCTNLYRGLGYNGAFCENMTQKVTLLREHPETMLELVAQPDDICANCPNLMGGDYCANGDNHVCVKDRALLAPLHLREGEMWPVRYFSITSDPMGTPKVAPKPAFSTYTQTAILGSW